MLSIPSASTTNIALQQQPSRPEATSLLLDTLSGPVRVQKKNMGAIHRDRYHLWPLNRAPCCIRGGTLHPHVLWCAGREPDNTYQGSDQSHLLQWSPEWAHWLSYHSRGSCSWSALPKEDFELPNARLHYAGGFATWSCYGGKSWPYQDFQSAVFSNTPSPIYY